MEDLYCVEDCVCDALQLGHLRLMDLMAYLLGWWNLQLWALHHLHITKMFSLLIRTGKLLEIWKFSYVIPIPKSSNTWSPCKYRPIFHLCIPSKMLEKHIYSLMFSHFDSYHPLSDSQWGFRPGCSTATALLSTVHNCLELLESGREIYTVFLDYRKDFDSLPHCPLVVKLRSIGFCDTLVVGWLIVYHLESNKLW